MRCESEGDYAVEVPFVLGSEGQKRQELWWGRKEIS